MFVCLFVCLFVCFKGKYIPSICYKIWFENQHNPAVPINLKGMAIGDGLTDPYSQVQGYADLAYSFGIADENEREVMRDLQVFHFCFLLYFILFLFFFYGAQET